MGDKDQLKRVSGQIEELTKTVQGHSVALESLKDVPALLQRLIASQAPPQNNNEYEPLNLSLGLEGTSGSEFGAGGGLEDGQYYDETGVEEPDLAELLGEQEKDTEFAAPVPDIVATAFNGTVAKQLSKETLAKLKETVKVPENCKGLMTPKMNPELWAHLPPPAKFLDIKTQSIQSTMLSGIVTFANLATEIANRPAELSPELKSTLLQLSKRGGAILGAGVQDLSLKRKLDVRPHIRPEYSSICTTANSTNEFLFGNALADAMKTSKAGASVVKSSPRSTRFSPYSKLRPSLNRFRPPPYTPKGFQRGGGQRRQYPQQARQSTFNKYHQPKQ